MSPDHYNKFGQFIITVKGDASLNQVAERAGMSPATLGRWMRAKPFRMLKPDAVQALAGALKIPADRLHVVALETAGYVAWMPSSTRRPMTTHQRKVVDAMARIDEQGQQAIADVALWVAEISRSASQATTHCSCGPRLDREDDESWLMREVQRSQRSRASSDTDNCRS